MEISHTRRGCSMAGMFLSVLCAQHTHRHAFRRWPACHRACANPCIGIPTTSVIYLNSGLGRTVLADFANAVWWLTQRHP